MALFGGFAEGYVDPQMLVAGDAAATVAKVLTNAGLIRLGVVAHLTGAVFFLFTALALFALLRQVHTSMARAMLFLVVVAVAITSLNAIFLFEGLRVASDASVATAFGPEGSNALVMVLLDIQHYGTFAAQVFFGLWLLPLGYLVYRSPGWFPKWLGFALYLGGLCYILDLLAAFVAPELFLRIHRLVVIPCIVAEVAMVLYLLVVGVRTPAPDPRLAVTS